VGWGRRFEQIPTLTSQNSRCSVANIDNQALNPLHDPLQTVALSRNDAVGIQRKGAELQRRKGRRRKNGSQTNDHRLVTQIGNANFFFAPHAKRLPLICSDLRHGDFALKSSRLTAWIRLSRFKAEVAKDWGQGEKSFFLLNSWVGLLQATGLCSLFRN
jgi:hypothetical protein